MTCANYNCDNIPFGTKIRCGKCRKRDLNECVGCDEITNRGAFYCVNCRDEHNWLIDMLIYNIALEEIKILVIYK